MQDQYKRDQELVQMSVDIKAMEIRIKELEKKNLKKKENKKSSDEIISPKNQFNQNFESDMLMRMEGFRNVMNQFLTKEEICQMFTSTIGEYMQNSDNSKNSEEIERLKNDLNTLKAEKEIWGTYLDNLKNLEQKLIINQEDNCRIRIVYLVLF